MLVRKQVYLTDKQGRRIKRRAKLHDSTEAEVIREALDRGLDRLSSRPLINDPQTKEEFFATLRALVNQGSARGKRTWVREDAYT